MRIMMALVMVAASGSALAGWQEVDQSQNSFVYADSATIRKTGSLVKMWHMYDFSEGQQSAGIPYLSIKAQMEYDCKSEQRRRIFEAVFSENMGNGTQGIANNTPKSEWEPVMPGTMGESLWKFACVKVKPK